MTLQTIQELRELEKEATPGKWGIAPSSHEKIFSVIVTVPSRMGDLTLTSGANRDEIPENDADLIVSLRNNAKALLDLAEECLRLREENAAARARGRADALAECREALRLAAGWERWGVRAGKFVPNHEWIEMEAVMRRRNEAGFTSAADEAAAREEATAGRTMLADAPDDARSLAIRQAGIDRIEKLRAEAERAWLQA